MSLKVLLADDSMTAQNMGKKILTDAGYQVIAVSNGAQALKKLASEKPDLVVLDVYMPGYSGLEVCERIKNAPDTARIPVVLCVAKMEPFKAEEGTRVRADAVIVKPFEATDLVTRIQELGDKIIRQPKRPKTEESERPDFVETSTDIIEPATHAAHVDVPEELAVEPAVGMELVAEEPTPQPESTVPAPTFPESFEIEHERQPVETLRDTRMQSVDGLSGVFEMRPPEVSPENAVPEFEIVSKPAASDESARPEDVHAQAAAAGHVEPRPEFVVDRVSISIPLKEPERLPEAQAPSAPEPPTSVGFPQPAEQMASSAGLPSFVAPEEDSPGTGYTGIYEFEPPRGSLESPAIETRLGDIRASDMAEFVEPSEALAQPSAAEMEVGSAVAVETAEPAADEIVSAVPLPVWVAEEVALDQCELNVSLEEEMRAALASSLSAQHVEVPLDLAAERLAAFTTEEEPVEMQSGAVTSEIQPVEFATAETRMGPATENLASERFETMSDDIMAESTSDRSWQVIPDSSANMPETGAMDALASLQGPVSDFSSEATVAPHFGIPGPSFDAVPASEFSLPMDTGIVIDAETIAPESAAGDFAAPQVESEIYSAPEAQFQPESMPSESPSAGSNPSPDNPPHAFGAMAQAIVDSPALSSLKGADAEPVVEAIVTRMLEQIKPELVAHVLRELEKK